MRSGLYVLVVVRVVCLQMALTGREPRYTRVVTLKQGNVQGRVVRPKRNAHVADVEVYLGIPYAAPPVGNLRFMPPGEPPQWPDTLDAARLKPVCPQMMPDGAGRASVERDAFVGRMRRYLRNESEDCLYLNIYVPHPQRREHTGAENRKYPVILFVHGESFEWNSGNLYDGSVVAGYGNVIFITINFRLGIFGFLKQGLTVGRANFGLSDQIAALQWTKRNIDEFGGDAGKITVMGHGTGAACVNFLMLSPVAEGLFHRAILASGSALSEWALTATPLHYIQLQDEFNCSSDDVVDCLQRKRKEDIVSAFKRYELPPFENFTPVVDEIVVLSSPADQMEKYTLFSKYDLLAGVTEVESYFLLEEEFLKLGMLTHEGHECLDKYAKIVFKKTPDKALMKIIEHYLGHLRDNSPIATRNAILDALSDLLVTAPLLQTVRYHASTPKNTFFYVFGHRTASEHGIKTNRSVYGDDLPYLLGVPIDGPSFHYQSEYTPQEQQLSEAMLKYFTNFAKTGNPYSSTSSEFNYNGYTVNRLSNTRWPPYNLDRQSYMYFGATTQVRHHYRQEEDVFWNQEMPKSMRLSDESAMESGPRGGVNDVVENDDVRSPPVYGLPSAPASDVAGATDNNFLNGAGWPGAGARDELAGAAAPPAAPQTSSWTATALVVAASLFLLANVVAFAFVFYQRGKLRMRENLFRNRFRCKTVSVPDLFDETESGDLYAVAEKRRLCADGVAGARAASDKAKKAQKRAIGVDFDGKRVASVKPEAMSGKRMRRWPLSRQCSGSTITVDAHSKVRDWIVNEVASVAAAARGATPRFSRKSAAKKRADAGADDRVGAIEMRTIERRRGPGPSDTVASSPLKVSVAVDATQATGTTPTGELHATQIPVQTMGCAHEPRGELVWRLAAGVAQSDGGCGDDEDIDEVDHGSRNAAGTHKSSAHIRLKTPQFLLETAPPTWHAHSRSDPSPMAAAPTAVDALYSRVDKGRTNRLTSFAGSGPSGSESPSECAEQASSSRHYEEINVTSRPDVDDEYVAPTAQQTLRNLVRRNFPKVLPDLARAQQKRANRLSLPAVCADTADGCADCYAKVSARSGRLPPPPPPRVTSTLGRRPAPNSAQSAQSADDEDVDGQQLSCITVRLKQNEAHAADERAPDLVQTESCHPPRPPPLPVHALFPVRALPPDSSPKKPKEVRSVTTSTTGIS